MNTDPSSEEGGHASAESRPAGEDTLGQIAQVSLRLLAGSVSKRSLEGLKRTLEASPSEYPWQVVTKVVLSEPCDEQDLAQRGLRAQRDWILRGGKIDAD